jgi:hypothetical protein
MRNEEEGERRSGKRKATETAGMDKRRRPMLVSRSPDRVSKSIDGEA